MIPKNVQEAAGGLPSSWATILLIIIFGLVFVLFVAFNKQILKFFGKIKLIINNFIVKTFGSKFRHADKKFKRKANIRNRGFANRVYRVFNNIIINLNLQKSGVTVFGLILFMIVTSLALTIVVALVFNFEFGLMIPMFGVALVGVFVVMEFKALGQKEKYEGEIMDAVDLLVSDVKGGIHNAIVRYMQSFHPDIRPYFKEFIENVNTKGLSFKSAMLILNDRLGITFSDFAHKAIIYEEKADAEFDDIFSSILEVNRHKRILRAKNNTAFSQIIMTFLVTFLAVAGYALYIAFTEPYVGNFLSHEIFGKILIIGDFLIFVVIIGYLTLLKSKSFE